MTQLELQGAAAKSAARTLATAGTALKNKALEAIADTLSARQAEWLAANAEDVAAAKASGMVPAMLDRLTLTPERVAGIVDAVRQVAALPDPIGKVDKTVSYTHLSPKAAARPGAPDTSWPARTAPAGAPPGAPARRSCR